MFEQGLPTAAGKLAGLGLAAKIAVGATVAMASVAGAGAAGVLPDAANERARGAIEAVTPVDFDEPAADHDDNFGSVVSSDATGESDGQPGVDGSEISSLAPGAAHRPDDAGQAPAQAGTPQNTGLGQAGDSPAGAHRPDDAGGAEEPPSTAPDTATVAPEVPSTLPAAAGAGADGTSHQPG